MITPELQCIVVTPEETIRDTLAEFVAVTLYDGEIGIGPGHTPLVGRLGCGELRITNDGQVERYYIEGGFVEVADSMVTVLTSRAIPATEVDEAVAQQRLLDAMARPATTDERMAQRDRAVEQSRSQLRVARRAK